VGEDRGRQVLDGLLVVAGASAAAVLLAVLGLPSPALFVFMGPRGQAMPRSPE